MTRTVWKYELDLIDEPQNRTMPRGATIVHVRAQRDVPCLWAEVDPSETTEARWFTVEGTGHPVARGGEYVGTATTHGDTLVWHIYEIPGGPDGH